MARRKRLTADKARMAIASVIDGKLTANEIGRLMDRIEAEDGPKAVIDAYVKLMDYVIPKLSRIEHAGHDGGALSVEHVLKDIAKRGGSSELPAIEHTPTIELEPLPEKLPAEQPINSAIDNSQIDHKPNTRGF